MNKTQKKKIVAAGLVQTRASSKKETIKCIPPWKLDWLYVCAERSPLDVGLIEGERASERKIPIKLAAARTAEPSRRKVLLFFSSMNFVVMN
jgi:hypothetical protein